MNPSTLHEHLPADGDVIVDVPGQSHQTDSSDVEAHNDSRPDSNEDKDDALKEADGGERGGDGGENDGNDEHKAMEYKLCLKN